MKEIEREGISKLLPELNEYSKPFWEGLNNEELRIQECQECNNVQFPPGPACQNCLSNDYKWIQASGKAKVWSKIGMWKKYLTPYSDIPYYVVLAKLEEGPIVIGRISEENNSIVSFDSDLNTTFYKTVDGTVLLGFKPS